MSFTLSRDEWGVPHLRADSARELAWAQGFATALDRAWQLEVERRRALGTSAALLGPDAIGWDRFARQARLADTARRCFHRLEPATRAWLTAYADGVNAGLGEGLRTAGEPCELPPGRHRPWTPLALWLSTHILHAGFPGKLWREEVARRLGEAHLDLFAADGPHGAGSNGWLLSGARTAAGAPLLAGDPHRFLEAPGVYQQVHLACPEYDVVGLAVPGVPGVQHFGHTGGVAWAITSAMADYQDLFWERLRRCDGRVEAFDANGWRPASARPELIEVAGAAPVEIEVIETARGPIILGGPDDAFAIGLRHPPRVSGELGFDALPRLLGATCVADVDRALSRWVEPVNVVLAADTRGGRLHRVAGRVPLRHEDNRLRVVPAWEPAHEWRGFHEPLPEAPVGELAVMANERGLAAPLGVDFAPPHRANRIRELLERGRTWTAAELARLHGDTKLPPSPIFALLTELGGRGGLDGLAPEAARLRERLLAWDRHMDAGSREAAAFAELRSELVRQIAAHPQLASLSLLAGDASPYPPLFHPWLDLTTRVAFALDGLLTRDRLALDRPALVRAALGAAARAPGLTWGEQHRLQPWQARPDGTDWPGLGGDHDCVLATSSIPGLTDRCLRAPVARFVWDLARREDSLWVVPLGAAGTGPRARDQLPVWLRGELLPVVTDPARLTVERRGQPPAVAPDRRPVLERALDGLGTLRVAPVDPIGDLDQIYAWVTGEWAHFWGMRRHSRDHVQEIYEYLDDLETHHAYLIRLDDRPLGIVQTYRPAADPVGEHFEVQPGDLGLHLLIAPPQTGAVPGFTARITEALFDHAFADPSVQRLVVEPDARNARALARIRRLGFVLGPQIDLPEKRAQLAFLTRDAFRG